MIFSCRENFLERKTLRKVSVVEMHFYRFLYSWSVTSQKRGKMRGGAAIAELAEVNHRNSWNFKRIISVLFKKINTYTDSYVESAGPTSSIRTSLPRTLAKLEVNSKSWHCFEGSNHGRDLGHFCSCFGGWMCFFSLPDAPNFPLFKGSADRDAEAFLLNISKVSHCILSVLGDWKVNRF